MFTASRHHLGSYSAFHPALTSESASKQAALRLASPSMTGVAPQPSQMSEALQRFLQQEDEDAGTDNGGVVTGELDSSTLDITSTSVSLEGKLIRQPHVLPLTELDSPPELQSINSRTDGNSVKIAHVHIVWLMCSVIAWDQLREVSAASSQRWLGYCLLKLASPPTSIAPPAVQLGPSDGHPTMSWAAVLSGLVGEVERLGEHEVLRAILDQGSDVREFGRQYDSQLRGAELDSIQDYILESDNLSLLHRQVRACLVLPVHREFCTVMQRRRRLRCSVAGFRRVHASAVARVWSSLRGSLTRPAPVRDSHLHDVWAMVRIQKVSGAQTAHLQSLVRGLSACPLRQPCACMQIEECDSILGAMETMLGRFQADLGNVSGEIRSLQVCLHLPQALRCRRLTQCW